jgi:hypothetical protein
MESVYCHTIPKDRWLNCENITTGYYYCYSYYFGHTKCYDLKESDDRYSRTLLCFRQNHFDDYFYTKEQLREIKINQLLDS